MNYTKIKMSDIANGPGVRSSIYVSGCTHNCHGCFNPETHDFNSGKPWTKDIEDKICILGARNDVVDIIKENIIIYLIY